MADDAIIIPVRAQTEAYKRGLMELAGFTETEASKAAGAFEKTALKKIVADNLKSAELSSKAWSEAGKKISETVGGSVGRLGNAVFELIPKAGAASAALGTVATAAVGIGAGVAVASGVAAAMYGLAEAADRAEARLDKAGRAALVPDDARESIERYRDASEALSVASDVLTVRLGAVAADGLARIEMSGLGALSTLDKIATAFDAAGISASGFEGKTARGIAALTTLGASEVLIRTVGAAYSYMADEGQRAADASQAVADAQAGADRQLQSNIDIWQREAEAEERIKADAAKRADALIARLEAERTANRKRAADERKRIAAKEAADELKVYQYVGDQILKESQDTIARQSAAQVELQSSMISRLTSDLKASVDAAQSALKDVFEETTREIEKMRAGSRAALDSLIQSGLQGIQLLADTQAQAAADDLAQTQQRHQAVVDALNEQRRIAAEAAREGQGFREAAARDEIAKLRIKKQALEEQAQNERAAAIRMARWQKAAALLAVGVSTAAAIGQAFAMFGPPPSPVGIASAAAATASGAVQAAAIAAKPIPKFYVGSSERVPGNAMGEQQATLHKGEMVLSSAGVDRLGGERVVAAINGLRGDVQGLGGSGGGGPVLLDGVAVGRQMAAQIGRGGALALAVRGGRMVGVVDPYGRS